MRFVRRPNEAGPSGAGGRRRLLRHRVRWVPVALPLALAALLAVGAMPAAAGDGVVAHTPGAGFYHSFFAGGSQSYMNLDSDQTWNQQISHGYEDTGLWVSQGRVVALAVTSREDFGCIYMGHTTGPGINTKRHQGPLYCPSYGPNTWYSCNSQTSECYFAASSVHPPAVVSRRQAARAAPSPTSPHHSTPPHPVAGSYSFVWPEGSGSLTINSDNTWSMTFTDPDTYTDTGYWDSMGNAVALTVDYSSTDSGCVFLGGLKKGGLNTVRKQGPFTCGGFAGKWYATTA